MLRELAQVYLLSENYAAAADALERALRIKLVPQAGDYLLLAQAYYQLGNLARVVGALDRSRSRDYCRAMAVTCCLTMSRVRDSHCWVSG